MYTLYVLINSLFVYIHNGAYSACRSIFFLSQFLHPPLCIPLPPCEYLPHNGPFSIPPCALLRPPVDFTLLTYAFYCPNQCMSSYSLCDFEKHNTYSINQITPLSKHRDGFHAHIWQMTNGIWDLQLLLPFATKMPILYMHILLETNLFRHFIIEIFFAEIFRTKTLKD